MIYHFIKTILRLCWLLSPSIMKKIRNTKV